MNRWNATRPWDTENYKLEKVGLGSGKLESIDSGDEIQSYEVI